MFAVLPKLKDADRDKLLRKREKQKAKDDSKLEKQRRLKEEKLRKVADKEKERDKKKQQKQKQKSTTSSIPGAPSKIADFIQVCTIKKLKIYKINDLCLFYSSLIKTTFPFSWRNAWGL